MIDSASLLFACCLVAAGVNMLDRLAIVETEEVANRGCTDGSGQRDTENNPVS